MPNARPVMFRSKPAGGDRSGAISNKTSLFTRAAAPQEQRYSCRRYRLWNVEPRFVLEKLERPVRGRYAVALAARASSVGNPKVSEVHAMSVPWPPRLAASAVRSDFLGFVFIRADSWFTFTGSRQIIAYYAVKRIHCSCHRRRARNWAGLCRGFRGSRSAGHLQLPSLPRRSRCDRRAISRQSGRHPGRCVGGSGYSSPL